MYPYPHFYNSSFFALKTERNKNNIRIKMFLKIPCFKTNELPNTFDILKEELPSVLKNKCVNEKNISFSEEVKNTEIGHLFEHLFLELIWQASFKKMGCFKGRTAWNWKKEKKGTFNIYAEVKNLSDEKVFSSLEKAIKLLEAVIESGEEERFQNKQVYRNFPLTIGQESCPMLLR